MKQIFILVSVLLGFVLSTVYAEIDAYRFDNAAQQNLYNELVNQLRCPKCQNQSIAESNAPVALDLRERVYVLIKAGKTEQEIVEHMINRYGHFISYRPPVNRSTYVLWFAPLVLLLVLLGAMMVRYRARRA